MIIQITGSDDDFQFRVVDEVDEGVMVTVATSRHYDSLDGVRNAVTEFQADVAGADVADLT